MKTLSKYQNRVISQSDLEYLKIHRKGLYRRAKRLNWRIATHELTPNLTLADFGIGEQQPQK
jgi:hypothetical protein